MENDILRFFMTQGPFAVLFVWLLIYVMRANKDREKSLQEENREREGRLQSLLEKFSEKYDVIITEIREMKERLPRD